MAFGMTENPRPQQTVGAGQAALDRFAQMMIDRMEQMKASDWKKGWIDGQGGGLPQNVGGRNYSGSNSFFLQMHTAMSGYQIPVYLTFKQAHNLKAHVLKGEKAFPVVYWDMLIKDKNGKRVQEHDYRAMSKEERKNLTVIPFVKAFLVYNIQQTNLQEVQPERVQKLLDKFKAPEFSDTRGMYMHPALDEMIRQQSWLCPIKADKPQNGAYYSPAHDMVVLPMKAQFNRGGSQDEIYRSGQEFYATMLHEMAHSTMTPERLNRETGGRFGDKKYAKEELVAELTAAMVSHSMGFDKKITDNSAAYLDSWIQTLKEEPKFITSVMTDVNKASELILDRVDAQQINLGAQPYLIKNDPLAPMDPNEEIPFKNAPTVNTRDGGHALRPSLDGQDSGLKPIEKSTAKTYFQLTDVRDKEAFLAMTVRKHFEPESSRLSQERSKSLGI